jgi:type II secretory pathway component GspD/PulD (secretin)
LNSWIVDGPRLAAPIQLKPAPGLKSLHIRATMPEAIKQVAAAYGIKASLDSTVTGSLQLKFDLDDVPYEQAMHVLMQMGPNFAVPLTPDSILVAKDNEENRQKYLRLVQETIYAAGMTNEQIAELGNMIKSVFEVKQVSVENSFGTLVVRAPEDTLRALNLTLADMLDGGSEVMIDLKLYSIDRMRTVNVGATAPSQFTAFSFGSQANALVAANQSLVNQAIAQGLIKPGASNVEIAIALLESGLVTSSLLTNLIGSFGGGISLFGIDATISPTFNLALNSSDTRALDEIQLRVGDRQSATFRAGSKYPITQSTYSTTTAASSAGLAGATINGVSVASLLNAATTATVPQVQYEDLGVTLKATPTIQKSGMISLHLDLKIESLAGGTVDNIPILNNNAFVSDITVGDGQTAFLVSNMTKSESAAVTGIPGLTDLPGFQSSPELDRTTDVGQLLMVLTPHLVRRRVNDTAGPRIPITMPASAATD